MKQYKLYLSILLLCCCVQATAQNALVPVDEETAKKKEINQIKRSEQAVYADIMEMASDDEEALSAAHQKSRDMLQAHVIEIFAKRMKMSKKDVQEIWDVIDDKCQNIVVKKGDLFRVFSYIMKDAIGLGPKKPKEGDVEKYMEKTATADSVATDPVVTDSVPIEVTHATQPKDSVVPAPIEPVQETTSTQPQEELSKEEKPKEEQPQPQKEETPVVPQPVVQPADPVVMQPTTPPAPAVETPARAKAMLAQSSINGLIRYLNTEKQNHTLIYGSMRTMQSPEKCYIIIIDKATQKVVSLLSPGSDSRTNYVTGQPDHLNNYKGGKHSAIFVQEY
ncbi:hypothetical protein [Bacteroides fluxus]|uniref:Conserved domain protein n=1 Tax=Bacteroides fluxus YIT 12057 TaxID=763034 RepID=F3PWR7_9BACE|nr:hypothetical protein [Bacteroides fluxus]EGF51996.1 conserved domain protein [Bacteroides fluxus YIT 12057]